MSGPDEDLLRRYRDASDAQACVPGEHVREAILAEGRAAARRYAASAVQGTPMERPAAARSPGAPGVRRRWIYTLAGVASAAVLAGILVLPGFLRPGPMETPTATMSAPRTIAQTESKRSKEAEPRTAPIAEPSPLPAPETSLATPPVAIRQVQPSPLFDAVIRDDPAKLRQALQAGAVVDARDSEGRTPLLLAVQLGRADLARALLDHGADPKAADSAGRTPLELARQLQRADLVDLLQRAAAGR